MAIAKILGLAAKAGSRTKLGRKKPFKYHFVKGTTSFEAESSYGTSVLGNKVFSYTMKSRKTPATKLKARLTKAVSKKISPKYRDFGVYIDKIKTVPASKRRAVKRYKKVIHKSPSYKTRGKDYHEHLEDRIESLGPGYFK